jgi:hypothetical protein
MGFQEIARFPEKVMKLLRKRCLAVVKLNRKVVDYKINEFLKFLR